MKFSSILIGPKKFSKTPISITEKLIRNLFEFFHYYGMINCKYCGEPLTVKHLLINCRTHIDIRKSLELPDNLFEALSPTHDNTNKIITFLKQINMLKVKQYFQPAPLDFIKGTTKEVNILITMNNNQKAIYPALFICLNFTSLINT
ncbi:Uncharacterized protein FWK35_00004316, partial [Aphis craccivora]